MTITLHADQNEPEVCRLRHSNCDLIVVNFNKLDDMGKVSISLIKRHCRVQLQSQVNTYRQSYYPLGLFKLLFGCPTVNFGSLLRGKPLSLDVHHFVLSMFDLKVTGFLVTRLGP